jgi:hypothetical protein
MAFIVPKKAETLKYQIQEAYYKNAIIFFMEYFIKMGDFINLINSLRSKSAIKDKRKKTKNYFSTDYTD